MLLLSSLTSGCSKVQEAAHDMSQNNCPPYLWVEYQQHIQQVVRRLWNDKFITSPETFGPQAGAVAYTLERDKPLTVSFLYEEDDTGRAYSLPTIEWTQRVLNDYEFREEIKYELLECVLNLQDSNYDVKPGKVVATMLGWGVRDYSGNVVREYALYDLDGDGSWDYLTGDTVGFYPHPTLKVHLSGDDDYLYHHINEYYKACLESDMPIVDLAGYDLTGKTLSYYEKLL
jgi:hypothetical protein